MCGVYGSCKTLKYARKSRNQENYEEQKSHLFGVFLSLFTIISSFFLNMGQFWKKTPEISIKNPSLLIYFYLNNQKLSLFCTPYQWETILLHVQKALSWDMFHNSSIPPRERGAHQSSNIVNFSGYFHSLHLIQEKSVKSVQY